MTDVVLRAVDLVKRYEAGAGSQPALAGVSLDIASGAFVSVMGPSGSGKSTLLHLLGALDTPTSGEVWFEGARLDSLRDRERTLIRRRRVGFVFQQFNLVPVLTVEENVELPLLVDRVPNRERASRVADVIELVLLGDERGRLPAQLSGGQQQRVALARALVTRPAVLLADEPTGNLDSATGAEVLGVVRTAQRELGQTVVMATHDARAASLGDEVVRLRDGLVVDRHAISRGGSPTVSAELSRLLDEDTIEV